MSKRDNLLIIKKDIEQEVEAHTLPLDTLRAIMDAYSDFILMDKTYTTFRKDVADWYSKYAFISVVSRGHIEFAINYYGDNSVAIDLKRKVVNVGREVCRRIDTAKDLNDFYAYIERFGDSDWEYNFDVDCERIDRLLEDADFGYEQGVYSRANVERILGQKL